MAGLYIHIPFCKKRCSYCSFISYEHKAHLIRRYLDAIKKEARIVSNLDLLDGLTFDTLYIGGGTPSLIPPRQLAKLMDYLFSVLPMATNRQIEMTLECNPESVTRDLIETAKDVGVNRISLGVQDLTKEGLTLLGRIHSTDHVNKAAEIVRSAGIGNLSVDLIYCLPGQDPDWLIKTLNRILTLTPSHISAYELSLEPDTPLWRLHKKKRIKLPDDELRYLLTKRLEDYLGSQGFFQYEISNFAKTGFQCRHNKNYWRCGDYLGLGCSAVSYLHGKRDFNTKKLETYIKMLDNGKRPVVESEHLEEEKRFREAFVIGLRMTQGINAKELEKRFGVDPFYYYSSLLEKMKRNGVMKLDKASGTIRLTERGRDVSNFVLGYFV